MEPVVVALKFLSFSWHIFSSASQNVTVKVTADRSVRRNKFMVNNPLHIEKKKTISMLFVELRTCRTSFALGDCGLSTAMIVALFLDHNCKSNFHHPVQS
jgi:hypothetical protein